MALTAGRSSSTGGGSTNASCVECGAAFYCGCPAPAAARTSEGTDAKLAFSCWCAALPPTLPVPSVAGIKGASSGSEAKRSGCLCPQCLGARVGRIGQPGEKAT